MPNINQDVQGRVDAFRDNPQALQERYAISNSLMDLLALQYIKSEKDQAAANAKLSAPGMPGTVQEQLTAEMGVGQGIGEQQNIGMPPSGGIAGDMSAFAEGGKIKGYASQGLVETDEKVARDFGMQKYEYMDPDAPEEDPEAVRKRIRDKIAAGEEEFGTGYQKELKDLDKTGKLKKYKDRLDRLRGEGFDDSSFKDDRLIQGLASMGGGPGAFARSTFTLSNQQKAAQKKFLDEMLTAEETFDDKETALTDKETTIRKAGELKLDTMTDKEIANLRAAATKRSGIIKDNNATLFNEIKGNIDYENIESQSETRKLEILSRRDIALKQITEKIHQQHAAMAVGFNQAQNAYANLSKQTDADPKDVQRAKDRVETMRKDLMASIKMTTDALGIGQQMEDLNAKMIAFGFTQAQIDAASSGLPISP